MTIKGVKELIAEAEAEIETLTVEQALAANDDPEVQLIDLRDIRELWREGVVPGALHVPRGMLEFWVAPDSAYHKDIFASGKKFIFFCALGHRSALATFAAQNMGLTPVAHIEGGYTAWKETGAPTEAKERK
ncbi:MAG: rhodanese-like domain-containing protein [Rhodospirillaceae bacterium]|jgi:rhodanese-related sulfurtransferase|nr:rhodanese-like domain-containing protein [Rhodospirillaceae bacterium]MBT4589796.1 rhodanese-like domain-containing protein [Rhodospirillaceae bacterium]MBT4938865.1 rhodanese-like domain-containing protein [Rhodospirillaceae bacterium]MBT5938411.1 rhodanese-like domain-containing protein [Rhodospirillaceae bacterium]MBT7268189.1 rhodanese-like domain-containing protein [Rhodospirillaceae bacterium]